MGIEPTSSAWEAEILPLNHTRYFAISVASGYQRCKLTVGYIEKPQRDGGLGEGT